MRELRVPVTPEVPCLVRPAEAGAPLVLALHGQGESEAVMAGRFVDEGPDVSWAFPRAPYPEERRRPDGIRVGHSWYQYTGDPDAFRESLRVTGAWVLGLLDRVLEETGADPDRVTLVGFSQGGYLAGSMAFTRPERFAAAALLGARYKTELLDGRFERVRGLRYFSAHGARDRAVPPEPSRERVDEMRAAGLDVEHREYACGHRVIPEMVADLVAWIGSGPGSDP
jgi:phospholipase/carboxylesterase